MKLKKGQDLTLTVSDIAFGGKGLAKIDDFAVFVDKAIAGDTVRARITKKKKNFAEARVLELLEPSPDRVPARCDYSGYCGGCKWQFLDYEKQLGFKTRHVADAIKHIGLIEGVPVLPALPSPHVFGYRNKMEFSCSESRWLMPHELNDPDVVKGMGIGLHVPGTFSKVIDIHECHIQPSLGNKILQTVREYITSSGLPVYGLKSHEGFWRFVMLRHSYAHDQWMVNIITANENSAVVMPLAELLTEQFPNIVSVVNNITSRKAGIAVGESEILLKGQPYITDKLGEFEFKISANSFFQTNTPGATQLYQTVEEYAALTGDETVVDLYSGTGTIPIWLSGKAKSVVGIEIVESSVADAHINAKNNGVTNCKFILGDIMDGLPSVADRPDVMIIDPPRVGMHKDVVAKVIEMKPGRIVYVSCNPATLARDLNMLKNDYHVVKAQPVDMFPHTYHVEAVALLEPIKK